MLYVEYATQEIVQTFPLSEEEKSQLLDFRDAVTRLLREAWTQAKEKLTTLYKAVAEGTYKLEGKRLYAPDGVWMYIDKTVMHIPIHSITTESISQMC
jgi:NAD dependent epimerase/dehydratase family enzyme